MYSRVLDDVTLAQVIAAAPEMPDEVEVLARKMVETLRRQADLLPESRAVRVVAAEGSRWRYEMTLKDVGELLGVTANQAGRAAREMGLKARRTREGYVLIWNDAQTNLLARYLGA